MKKFQKMTMIALLAMGMIACDSDDDAAPAPQTITDIAAANPNFSTLVAALQRTGLDDVLDAPGSYTVFAPTNDAFNTFLDGASVNDVDLATLENILLNHVVAGSIQSSQLSTGYVSTLAKRVPSATNNLSMYVSTANNGVQLNGVSSVTPGGANIIASNGVIHVVNAVIGLPTVVTFATADPNFSDLVDALTSEGQPDFVSVLSGAGPFTVFAPTNAAFTALDAELAAIPLVPDAALLTEVLEYHVVAGNVLSSSLTNNQEVTTLQGGTFTVGLTGGAKITDANARISNIVAVDVQAANGVIHVLDKVLLPEL